MTTTTTRPQWTLGERLAKARSHAGFEQDEMAEHMHVSRATVSNYERGRSTPSYAVLTLWATVTGVELDWLTEGVDLARPRASHRARVTGSVTTRHLRRSPRARPRQCQVLVT